MMLLLEIVLLIAGAFAFIASYGIEDWDKRLLSVVTGIILFIILAAVLIGSRV